MGGGEGLGLGGCGRGGPGEIGGPRMLVLAWAELSALGRHPPYARRCCGGPESWTGCLDGGGWHPPPPPCRPHCHPSPQPPLSPGHTQASEHAHNRRGHNCQHPWSHGPSTALTLITSPCALSPMQPLPHHYSPSPTTAALPLGHLLLFTPFY